MTDRSTSPTVPPAEVDMSSRDSSGRRRRHRATVFTVLRHPRALWRFLTDRDAPLWPRLLAIATLAYVLLPFDAIPDVIPIVGWLDDLGVVTFALGFVASRAARYIDRSEVLPEQTSS